MLPTLCVCARVRVYVSTCACVCVLIEAACGLEIQVPAGHREARNQREARLGHLTQ